MELIVYVAILGMVSVLVANFLIQIVNTYQRARVEREVLSNSRLILEAVTKTIASSKEVYSPTSKFNSDLGQLSLLTSATSMPGHTSVYIDFWMDNGLFYMRQEGKGTVALSASSVRLNKFRVERIYQALNREAIKVTLALDHAEPRFSAPITLNATTALRGNY